MLAELFLHGDRLIRWRQRAGSRTVKPVFAPVRYPFVRADTAYDYRETSTTGNRGGSPARGE